MKRILVPTIATILMVVVSTAAEEKKAANEDALKSEKYGPAPAYNPEKGTAVSTEAKGAIEKVKNPNPDAYKYTKEYQKLTPGQQKDADASIKAHKEIMDDIKEQKNSSGGAASAR